MFLLYLFRDIRLLYSLAFFKLQVWSSDAYALLIRYFHTKVFFYLECSFL